MSFAVIDKNAIMDDERVQRLKKIKLLQRENAEMAPFWAEKQKALFPTAIQLTQTPSIGQIITEEAQRNADNPDVLYQRAEQKIKQIADNANTEYILDRLNDLDLKYLVNGWDGIVKQIKEKYSASGGLDKDIFLKIVKENASNMDTSLSGIQTNDLTVRGKLRKDQKVQENKLIDDKAEEQFKQEIEDRKAMAKISKTNETKKSKELQEQEKKDKKAKVLLELERKAKEAEQIRKAREQADAAKLAEEQKIQDFLKLTDTVKLFNTKTFKDEYALKKRELDQTIKALKPQEKKDKIEEAKREPLFLELLNKYPGKRELEVWKLYNYMVITNNLLETEQELASTDPDKLNDLEENLLFNKQLKKAVGSPTKTNPKKPSIRLNKENMTIYNDKKLFFDNTYKNMIGEDLNDEYNLHVENDPDVDNIKRSII